MVNTKVVVFLKNGLHTSPGLEICSKHPARIIFFSQPARTHINRSGYLEKDAEFWTPHLEKDAKKLDKVRGGQPGGGGDQKPSPRRKDLKGGPTDEGQDLCSNIPE